MHYSCVVSSLFTNRARLREKNPLDWVGLPLSARSPSSVSKLQNTCSREKLATCNLQPATCRLQTANPGIILHSSKPCMVRKGGFVYINCNISSSARWLRKRRKGRGVSSTSNVITCLMKLKGFEGAKEH